MIYNKKYSFELYNYITSDDSLLKTVRNVLNNRSSVVCECNGERRTYGFIGNGCGITYLKYKGIKAKQINEAASEIYSDVNKYIESAFSESELQELKDYGCPLQAVLTQDQEIQKAYYSRVIKFAKEHGINGLSIYSVID